MLDLFRDHFPKIWIDKLSNIYINLIQDYKKTIPINTFNYFFNPGKHIVPYDFKVSEELLSYFNHLLFGPNIFILDYIIRNKEKFNELKILDYGCGVGILSVFLAKIGINCYNYDNFKQIPLTDFNNRIKDKLRLEIAPVSNNYDNQTNVILCSGIDIDKDKEILDYVDIKYLLLDYRLNHWAGQFLGNKFDIIMGYDRILQIFRRR